MISIEAPERKVIQAQFQDPILYVMMILSYAFSNQSNKSYFFTPMMDYIPEGGNSQNF